MTRFNVEITPESVSKIKKMMEAGGINTQKELFNYSLTLLQWAMRERKSGRAIGSMNGNNDFRELQMPAIEHVVDSKVDL